MLLRLLCEAVSCVYNSHINIFKELAVVEQCFSDNLPLELERCRFC